MIDGHRHVQEVAEFALQEAGIAAWLYRTVYGHGLSVPFEKVETWMLRGGECEGFSTTLSRSKPLVNLVVKSKRRSAFYKCFVSTAPKSEEVPPCRWNPSRRAERLGDDILRLTRVGSLGDIKPSDFCHQRRSARHSAWRIVTAKHNQSKHIKTNFTGIAEFWDFTSNLPGWPGLF
jgi:hypothetical protein